MPTFTGDNSDNILTGGSENDTLIGNGGNDRLTGSGGDDILIGNTGSDTLDGGDGDDRIFSHDIDPAFTGNFSRGVSSDVFATPDVLTGGAGDDYIFAGYGDSVDGGVQGSYGNALYISFMGATAGVQVDFRLVQTQSSITVGGATITNIQRVGYLEGSNFDDLLVPLDNYYPLGGSVYGRGGNDHIIAGYYSGWGSSGLYGGEGNDILDGRPAQYNPNLYGEAGDDTIYTSIWSVAYGGDGNDTIFAQDDVYGGNGDDTITLSYSYYSGRRIAGEAGNDTITGSDGYGETIAGGTGADRVTTGSSNDALGSGDFLDDTSLTFADDNGLELDVLDSGSGNDILSIGYGDSADGGLGNDILRVSLAGLTAGINLNTSVFTSSAPATFGGGTIANIETIAYLRATNFADTLTLATQSSLLTVDAGAGNDVIVSQNSSVAVRGGDGNDVFMTGLAGDIFDGGNGVDAISYVLATAGVTVTLGLNGATGSGAGGDQLTNVENIVGSYQDDNLTGNEQANQFFGEAGADTLSGGAGDDSLYGGDGADLINGDSGNDNLDGGTGIDTMTGGLGDDLYSVNVLEDVVRETGTNGGNDIVLSTAALFILPAHVEILQLLDSGGNSSGHGNDQDNYLTGNSGNNNLKGFGGNDTLSGWDGVDMLTGGAGDDTFHGTAAHLNGDTIADLARGDRIVISDASLATFTFSLSGNTLSYTGGSLTLASLPASRIVATAAAGGGVQLAIAGDARYDFNGDGRSDVLWRHDNGTVTNWLGTDNGGFGDNWGASANSITNDWTIAGVGDFNGDGRDDILWRHDNGTVTDWLGTANGGFVGNWGASANSITNDWTIAGVGDFNGDGRGDILWRHDNGTVTNWLGTSNGGFVGNWDASANGITNDWTISGVGDFNGDGRDDVLWRHDNGTVTNWLGTANGGFAGNWGASANSITNDWTIAGVGDFNGDSRDDILWRHDNGTVTDWLGTSNGGFTGNWGVLARGVLSDSMVAGTGDFNGDGRDDILWRNGNGTVSSWFGTTNGGFLDGSNAYPLSNDWHVQPSDYLT